MDRIAEQYVKLVLRVGQHDADYVDAYYGPSEWRPAKDAPKPPLDTLRAEASAVLQALAASARPAGDEMLALRHEFLARTTTAVEARIRMLQGERFTFDEESRLLYDAVAPSHPPSYFEATLEELDAKLPGEGPLTARYERFKRDFIIPKEKLDTVFRAAIEACRSRTRAHVELPANERFTLEYVTDKPWSGYNWFQGNSASLIQINTDLPIYIDRAVDLACHEGYPGHHVYHMLMEEHLVRRRGWVEYSVYPLFAPQSLIAEGTANFGIEVAFPGEERIAFERERLFPLAGIDPKRADEYYGVMGLVERLSYAQNEAARGYLDGKMTRDEAIAWLEKYALSERQRAEQRVRFIERYRAYVINYNLGKDLVRRHIEALGGTPDHPDKRWQEFAALLSSPRLPSGLRK
ncbi:MAG TPA: hypothetical protein VNK41_08225 [Vicinamibacterales bacterium]|nr:hypothetical protein [Vicinamibacterales bacterium]